MFLGIAIFLYVVETHFVHSRLLTIIKKKPPLMFS